MFPSFCQLRVKQLTKSKELVLFYKYSGLHYRNSAVKAMIPACGE